jgi:hypothetical protein
MQYPGCDSQFSAPRAKFALLVQDVINGQQHPDHHQRSRSRFGQLAGHPGGTLPEPGCIAD